MNIGRQSIVLCSVCLFALGGCEPAQGIRARKDAVESRRQGTAIAANQRSLRLQKVMKLPKSGYAIGALVFTGDGNRLMVAAGGRSELGAKGALSLWRIADRRFAYMRRINRHYTKLLVMPGGKKLIAMDRRHIDVWNIDKGVQTATLPGSQWVDVAISPDGRILAAILSEGGPSRELHVFDTSKWRTIRTLKVKASTPSVHVTQGLLLPAGFALVPGTRLALAPNGRIVPADSIHSGEYVLFSRDGSRLFVNNTTRDVATWKAVPGGLLHRRPSAQGQLSPAEAAWGHNALRAAKEHNPSAMLVVAFSPNGVHMATGGAHIEDRQVILWRSQETGPSEVPASQKAQRPTP